MRGVLLVAAVVLAVAAGLLAPGVAGAQGCPEANPTYFDACGPTFVLPGWGDADGWTDPSQYSTIHLADVNGDGTDELIGRNDQGLEVWWFDTSVGQWRPQVDANDVPQSLTDFRSPRPGETLATDFTQPEYYSTINAGNVDGAPGDEVYARFADGMHVYKYVPPDGSTSINGGSWQQIGAGGAFSDAVGGNDPSIYSTIHLADLGLAVPTFFGRRQATSAQPGQVTYSGLLNGQWGGDSDLESPFQQPLETFDDQVCGLPSCYLSIQAANVAPDGTVSDFSTDPPEFTLPDRPNEILQRTVAGVAGYTFGTIGLADGSGPPWFAIGPAASYPYGVGGVLNEPPYGPFADVPSADCPFSAAGASGPGSSDCLGTSPSYYETLQAANIDGRPGDELLARASDGLRVKRWNGSGYDSLATLHALAGAPGSIPPGVWGSIRTGDINGDGKADVLFVDAKGQLEAWTYDPGANQWNELPTTTQLNLGTDFVNNPAYYSTLQVGDVNGDGRADVVARGPFGIRTWFYNRRGTGGWETYLPSGYPAFPTAGQQAAFAELNQQAKAATNPIIPKGDNTVRDVWTGEGAPDSNDLSNLQQGILSFAGCSGLNPGTPPSYQSCTPPAGSVGFSADDWTTVVNEMLSEIAAQQQVNSFYYGSSNSLSSARQSLFISEGATLPAIIGDLQLAGAAGNSADFNLQSFFSGSSGIAASIAGVVPAAGGPEASAALWVLSELISMLPSASPTATSSFQTTYAGLQDKFATIIQQTQNALDSESQQVRSDLALSTLVAQLRERGTWNLDQVGMRSAGNEGFALWVYQQLLPTIYQRYAISNCVDQTGSSTDLVCTLPQGPYVVGNPDGKGTSGTWLSSDTGTQCSTETNPKNRRTDTLCDYAGQQGVIPNSLADIVWGPVSDSCNYVPGNPNTAWTFGCSLGVPIATSIGADSFGWTFTTLTGNPVCCESGAVRATTGLVRGGGTGRLGTRAGASATAPRDTLGPLRFAGATFVPHTLRLSHMRVTVDRILYDHGRREELARTRAGRRLRPFALRRRRGGVFVSRGRNVPQVTLTLRRRDARGRAHLNLRLTRIHTRDVRALCAVLPARIARAGRPLELETRLRLRDGARTSGITLRQRWRCVRDGKGEFTGIRPIQPRRLAARPGLAVRLHAPRMVAPGQHATVLVTVTNRRRPRPSRVVSSLWHLRITGTAGGRPHTIGSKELRARRSRRLHLRLAVPRTARRRVCIHVVASADSARRARARRCIRIASAPGSTG